MKLTRTTIALLACLALNFVFIGIFCGLALQKGSSAEEQRAHPAISTARRETRHQIRQMLSEIREDAAAERAAYRKARQALNATLSVDPLDMEQARSELAALRETEDAMRLRMQTNLLNQLPNLPIEQRKRIARRLISGERPRRGQNRPHSRSD